MTNEEEVKRRIAVSAQISDAIGVDADSRIRIQEYTTAKGGLSINRQQLLKDLSKYGGTVVGKGQGEFTGGIEVPKGRQIGVISQKTDNFTIKSLQKLDGVTDSDWLKFQELLQSAPKTEYQPSYLPQDILSMENR